MGSDAWLARINTVMDAVRDDPAAAHTLDSLADRAHASPHHFHTKFREVTGETPVQFVRRSRLERAAYLMMANPTETLTEIGYATGFSEPSDFSRSFKRHYGVAPSAWDRRSRPAAPTPAVGDDVPVVRIISRPAVRLAAVSVRGIFGIDDLSAGYATLCDWMRSRELPLDRSALLGASFDNYRTTPLDRIHYTFGFTVDDDVVVDGPVHSRTLPAFTAAAVAIHGPLSAIAVAWDHLYDEWFPSRPWSPSALPGLKLFRSRPDQTGWGTFDLDCAIAFRTPPTDTNWMAPGRE